MEITTNRVKELIEATFEDSWKFYKLLAENMTPKEKNERKYELIYRSCLTCMNCSCRVPYNEKIGHDENGNPEGYKCVDWENDELIGRSIILQKIDIRDIK